MNPFRVLADIRFCVLKDCVHVNSPYCIKWAIFRIVTRQLFLGRLVVVVGFGGCWVFGFGLGRGRITGSAHKCVQHSSCFVRHDCQRERERESNVREVDRNFRNVSLQMIKEWTNGWKKMVSNKRPVSLLIGVPYRGCWLSGGLFYLWDSLSEGSRQKYDS